MQVMPPRIAVFCGSASGARPLFADAAAAFGREMARRKIGLVYGGASIGLMRTLADAVLEAGGEVDGVMPDFMVERELLHPHLTRTHRVPDMHTRKALMARLSDAFVALPGGFGTLDELFEILTWRMIRLHDKPVGLLDVGGYWIPLKELVQHQIREGFVRPAEIARLIVGESPHDLIDALNLPSA